MRFKITLILAVASFLSAVPVGAKDGSVTSADGVPIRFSDQGRGDPALVFIHCWSCDRGYWDAQVEHFGRDHRVVAIDLAGHGESGDQREDYRMEAYGQDVAVVLEELDLKGVILVGHSMGGAVVVEAALAAPERVAGLVGVDIFQDVTMELTPEMIEGFVVYFEGDFVSRVTGWVGQMFPAGADSALAAEIAADMAGGPPEVALSSMRNSLAWYGGAAPARLTELKVPLMCVNADQQPTNEEAIRAIVPAYQVRYQEGRGHFLMREDPATFNKLLAEILAAFAP